MNVPQTLIDKLWASHEIVCRADGEALLWVDRHFVHVLSSIRLGEANIEADAEPACSASETARIHAGINTY